MLDLDYYYYYYYYYYCYYYYYSLLTDTLSFSTESDRDWGANWRNVPFHRSHYL